MTNNLYWISALTYGIVLSIIIINEQRIKREFTQIENSFRMLNIGVIWFCVLDMVCGMCMSGLLQSTPVFYVAMELLHLFAVVTTFFWLNFILVYLGIKGIQRKRYLYLDGLVIVFEFILVIVNIFNPVLFSLVDGEYVPGVMRTFTFTNQYMVYLAIGIITFVCALKASSEERARYNAVLAFAMAPILLGLFQFLFPEAPFYSLGYFLGAFIAHTFIVTEDRENAIKKELQYESNNDALTGLLNRRAYESDLITYKDHELEDNIVYMSMDVNELKIVNDSLGHDAGDEIIIGAAECMKKCLGSYGRIYRTGGDEFIAIIFANSNEFKQIKADFEETVAAWRGKLVYGLSVSCGYAFKSDVEIARIAEISKVAENRMYEEKTRYYQKKGFDRRGQKDAHAVLCSLYTKILKVNITEDTYQIINMDEKEKSEKCGFSGVLSEWIINFGKCGMVHPDDLEEYYEALRFENIAKYFARRKTSLHIFYRRKIGREYKQVMMEIIPSNDYSKDSKTFYLYVKNIDE